jgi:hypothetical protein
MCLRGGQFVGKVCGESLQGKLVWASRFFSHWLLTSARSVLTLISLRPVQ